MTVVVSIPITGSPCGSTFQIVPNPYIAAMNLSFQLARQFREVYFGGNWTASNLKANLEGVTWEQATTKVMSFNTIVALVYHIHYYVHAVLNVIEGASLQAHDQYSFDHPPIATEADWQQFLQTVWADAESFAGHVAQLPESRLWENLQDEKYGTVYRNIQGIIEHTHYYLGQIVILKKMIMPTA